MYAKLRDRMNVAFWLCLNQGRREDACRLVRRFDSWWANRCAGP